VNGSFALDVVPCTANIASILLPTRQTSSSWSGRRAIDLPAAAEGAVVVICGRRGAAQLLLLFDECSCAGPVEFVTRLDELVKLVVEVKALSDKWSVLQLAAEVEAGAHSNHCKDPNSGTQRVIAF